MVANDSQVDGDHYKSLTIQPWDAMQAWMSHEAFCGYLLGNVFKYIIRYRRKGGVVSLRKAQHCLAKLIEVVELGAQ